MSPFVADMKRYSSTNEATDVINGSPLFNIRVRGIYSTAISKLLLDSGFNIVQSSDIIKDRLKIKKVAEYYDVDIKDLYNKQGISIIGNKLGLDTIIKIFSDKLLDIVVNKSQFPIDGIYVGKVLSIKNNTALVSIGNKEIGILFLNSIKPSIGDKILVQIERERIIKRRLTLSSKIRVPGKYIILLDNHSVKISRKILSDETRRRFYEIGKRVIKNSNFGVIIRSSALNKSEEVITKEFHELSELYMKILEKFERSKEEKLIWASQYYAEIIFPYISKVVLDLIRRKVISTIRFHHKFKASGFFISKLVDEYELSSNISYEMFIERAREYYFKIGDLIKIYHIKTSGKNIVLGPALILDMNKNLTKVKVRRNINGIGMYDGLNIQKENGDYAITSFKQGSWFYETKYFSKNGEYKGSYFNINTPIEIYPDSVKYVDLEVDIVKNMSGEKKVIDSEKFKKLHEEGYINTSIFKIVKNIIRLILKNY